MAPKKSSKASSKKGKKKASKTKKVESDEMFFEPVTYVARDITTTISLLGSNEDGIIRHALLVLVNNTHNDKKFVEHIFAKDVLPQLLNLVYHKDILILRTTLKLLSEVLCIPNATTQINMQEWQTYMNQLLCIFLENNDIIIKELVTYVIKLLTNGNTILSMSLMKSEIIQRIFKNLQQVCDADVRYNLLQLVNNIVDVETANEILLSLGHFNLKIILCFFKCDIPSLCDCATDIIMKISYWRHEPLQNILLKEKILHEITNLIFDEKHTEQQVKLLNILSVFMETEEVAMQYTESIDFFRICQFIPTCVKETILPVAIIIHKLTKHPVMIQRLFDLSVEDALLSLFRLKNLDVVYYICLSIINFSKHKLCCLKICTPAVLKIILDGCVNPTVDVVPHKEIYLKTIYELITKNPSAMETVADLGGLPIFTYIFQNISNEMTIGGFDIFLEIIHLFSLSNEYKLQVMNKKIYKITIDLVQFKVSQTLSILSQYMTYEEYRNLFIEENGPVIIVQRLSDVHSEDMFKLILIFIHNTLLYTAIGQIYIKIGLIGFLKAMKKRMHWDIPMVDSLIKMLYSLNLPLKFHETNKLDITDITKNNFYIIRELYKGQCPFYKILESGISSPNVTIYVLDFRETTNSSVDEEQGTSLIGSSDIQYPDFNNYLLDLDSSLFNITSDNKLDLSISDDREDLPSFLKYVTCKPQTIGTSTVDTDRMPRVSFSEPEDEEIDKVYSIQAIPSYITFDISNDSKKLQKYLTEARHDLYNNQKVILCYSHKVKILAKHVHSVLTLNDCWDVESKQLFYMQLQLLKKKLGSSIIPFKHLRCGLHCEKALLFKCLADRLQMPATLVRGNGIYWNEVPIVNTEPFDAPERDKHVAFHIVDLMNDIGSLMLVGSDKANIYCRH